MSAPLALVLGPSRAAISGVSTHVNALFQSDLALAFRLAHFQVGSEGRSESRLRRLARTAASPAALAAAIVRLDAAIVHVNTSLNAKAWWRDLAYVVVAKLCGARVVLQKHGGDLGRFTANPAFGFLVRRALRLADFIVVLSQAELEAFRALARGARIAAVPNGIDAAPYQRRERPAGAGAPLELLYIGRLAPAKGLSEALEAVALVRAEGLGTRLVIVGSGTEEEGLRVRARELGMDDAVVFAGPAWGEDKARRLAAADVLLLPSYSEGLPYALLESMAAGVVPIVTPVGAIPDVVTAGVHGLFVPVGDARSIACAIRRLHSDRRALERMSRACRARVAAGYSLERLASDFIAVYSAVLPCPASQAG